MYLCERFCNAEGHYTFASSTVCSLLFLSVKMCGQYWPIAYCLLPIAYCLLPIAFCLLPVTYCRTVRVGRYAVPYSTQYRTVGRYIDSY